MIVDEFTIERYKHTCSVLKHLCSDNMLKKWSTPDLSSNNAAFMYRGSFMDCVEFLYGFLPELYKEYCRYNYLTIYIRPNCKPGTLDYIGAVYDNDIISKEQKLFMMELTKLRGTLIHKTLVSKGYYYNNIGKLISAIKAKDIQNLLNSELKIVKNLNLISDIGKNPRLITVVKRDTQSMDNF